MSIKEHPPQHVPVLLDASLELLQPKSGESYLDLTAGYGGHADAFLGRTANYESACLVDRDDMALHALERFRSKGTRLLHTDFVSASRQLIQEGRQFDIILVDLGVSSPQLDINERGFSFTHSGPLDMRMDRRQSLTAAEYINSVAETELAEVIAQYGEESRATAKRYARGIVDARPFRDTGELAAVIAEAHIGKWQRIHPATRTFQAIRIVVNSELDQVEQLLKLLPNLLSEQGRAGIITFHSLEDRLVKRYFAEQAASGYEAELRLINKKPRSGHEDVNNPRARSAKLRAVAKIKKGRG